MTYLVVGLFDDLMGPFHIYMPFPKIVQSIPISAHKAIYEQKSFL